MADKPARSATATARDLLRQIDESLGSVDDRYVTNEQLHAALHGLTAVVRLFVDHDNGLGSAVAE